MAIVRWEPARDVASLQQDVNRVFSTFFDPGTAGSGAGTSRWVPPVDLEELEDAFLLVADLPGVSEDDVAIDVEGDVLTVSGARTRRRPSAVSTVRAERGHGSFRRQLTLPEGVDADRITARFDRGVLEVEIPKPEKARPRRVSIQVGGTVSAVDGGRTRDGQDEDGAGSTASPPRGGSPEPAGAVV